MKFKKTPALLDLVHWCIEEHKIKFALSGSSARKLKRGGANLLANRAAHFKLFPFSHVELQSDFDFNKALGFGLLPRLWNEDLSAEDMSRALYSYVQTYLKEEVAAEQLVRALRRELSEPLSSGSYTYGDVFETFVVNEFQKLISDNELQWRMFYLRTKSDLEIDLIIERPGSSALLIEIKSSSKVTIDHLKNLKLIAKDFPQSSRYLLSNDPVAREVEDVHVLHWAEGLKSIFKGMP